jgi:hypothetical protein
LAFLVEHPRIARIEVGVELISDRDARSHDEGAIVMHPDFPHPVRHFTLSRRHAALDLRIFFAWDGLLAYRDASPVEAEHR